MKLSQLGKLYIHTEISFVGLFSVKQRYSHRDRLINDSVAPSDEQNQIKPWEKKTAFSQFPKSWIVNFTSFRRRPACESSPLRAET